MNLKAIKVAIFLVVFALFVSMVIPAGAGTSNGYEKNLMTPTGSGKSHESMESLYHPVLTIEETKMSYMIEDEEGNKIRVSLPSGIEEKEIEHRIIEEIEEISTQDRIHHEKNKEKPQTNQPDDDLPEIPNKTPAPEGSTRITLRTFYQTEEFNDGFLFCDVDGLLLFDASDLLSSSKVKKYEWDFNNDGIYEKVSQSPMLEHRFNTIGLYKLYIKITYSYDYTYYRIYPSNFEGYYSQPIPFQSITMTEAISFDTRKNVDTGYISTSTISEAVPSYSRDNDYAISIEPDIEYFYTPIVESQRDVEYEITVSVGSKENGYPPILDFELSSGVEDILSIDNSIQIESPTIGIRNVNQEIPKILEPQIITDLNGNESKDASKTPIIYVKVKNIIEDEMFYFENFEVKFDSAKTIDQNEETIFTWDFGDGESIEGTEVSHKYTHRGIYTATLYVEGWDHSLSKTFVVLRGSEEPNLVIMKNNYSYYTDNFLLCSLNEPMIFDVHNVVGFSDYRWIEWDFNSDGIYEEKVTSTFITNVFLEPGYFQVSFRIPTSYQENQYILYNTTSISPGVDNTQKSTVTHSYTTYWIKVIVKGEDSDFPLIPDFTTKAPYSYSWWNHQDIVEDYNYATEQKDITYLKYYSKWDNRLNSWKNPVSFSANSTLLPEGTTYDDFSYSWDFGDGDTATGFEVSHEFENSNEDYQVKLTVWNDNYHMSIIKMVAPRPYSPNIYLYRDTPSYDTIRVIVDGGVTKAVPFVNLGSEIVWEDVFIENGKLFYNGESYDFLYYEELLNEPRTSDYGWILERDEKGNLFLDGKMLSLEELKDFFRTELEKAGLFENEIEDFVDEWLGEGARLFPGETAFRYAIMYISEDIMDEIIQIETEKEYEEIIRVHFLIQPINGDIHLVPPEYPNHAKGDNILHEWGVYFGDPIYEDEKDSQQIPSPDSLLEGCYGSQMYMTFEKKIGEHVLRPV